MKARLLIPAAGMGERLGGRGPKALVEIGGTPMLIRTLRRFEKLGLAHDATILVPAGHEHAFIWLLGEAFPEHQFHVAPGGAERQESVRMGLESLPSDTDIVVIHDAARPFVTEEAIAASIEAAARHGAATVAIPAVDTILEADEGQMLLRTPPRKCLWSCQTPQTFRLSVILAAHREAQTRGLVTTDDATLAQLMGNPVKLVEGHPLNFKVTLPTDLELANLLVRENLV